MQAGKLYVSIPKDLSPYDITADQAVELIKAKREADANKFIKDFGTDLPGVQILNGRFGPYIAYKKEGEKRAVNYRIPKNEDPAALTIDRVKELIEAQDAAPKKTRRKK